MSTKTKQTAAQLEPRVSLCDSNPYTFLTELEKLIAQGYRINFNEMFVLLPNCQITTVELPTT